MKTAIILMLKNLATMFISQAMIFWVLDKYTKYTDNLIDDNVVLIVKGAFENDVDLVKKGIDGLLVILKKKGIDDDK